MKRTNAAAVLLLFALFVGCADERAGVEVFYVGPARRIEVAIGSGVCIPTEGYHHFRCGVLAGNQRVSLRCLDMDLPIAYLDGYFQHGSDSNLAVFNRVCDLSSNDVIAENARAKGTLMVWGR